MAKGVEQALKDRQNIKLEELILEQNKKKAKNLNILERIRQTPEEKLCTTVNILKRSVSSLPLPNMMAGQNS